MLLFVLLVSVPILCAQRPLSDSLTNGHLNKVFCVTDEQCADDEICEKLCLWTHPKGWFVGCKVLCVKRARDTSLPDVFDTPTKNTRVPVSIQRPTTRTTSTTTPSSTRITSANSIDKSKTVRKLKPKTTALKSSNSTDPALRFGSDFQLDTDEYDLLNAAGSGDGPLENRRSQPVSRGSPPSIAPIGLRLQDSCPPPKICTADCGIVITDAGCQDCQCVWKGAKCTTDAECKPVEYCENGACWCKDGYRQSITQQGVCEQIPAGGALPPAATRRKPKPPAVGNGNLPNVPNLPNLPNLPPAEEPPPSKPTPTPSSVVEEETAIPSVSPIDGAVTTAPPVPTEPYGVPPTSSGTMEPSDSGSPSDTTPAGSSEVGIIDAFPLPDLPDEANAIPMLPPLGRAGVSIVNGETEQTLPAPRPAESGAASEVGNLPYSGDPPIGNSAAVGGLPNKNRKHVVRSLRDLKRQRTQWTIGRSDFTAVPVRHFWPGFF